LSVGKLAILSKRTFATFEVMLAELSFILLLECIELPLISIEVVIV